MKKCKVLIYVVVFLVAGKFSPLFAVPIGDSNLGRKYLVTAEDLGNWCCGLYSSSRDRDVQSGGKTLPMKSHTMAGYVGYSYKPWFITYVVIGNSKTKIGFSGHPNSESEYGFGMLFNILDHDILDPTLFEDRIRINAGWQYSASKTQWGAGNKTKWRELSASLTVSIVNDIVGDKRYYPMSIALFAGPIYSDIMSSSIDEKEKFGFTAGLEVFYTQRVSFYCGIENFGDDAFMGGVNVRF